MVPCVFEVYREHFICYIIDLQLFTCEICSLLKSNLLFNTLHLVYAIAFYSHFMLVSILKGHTLMLHTDLLSL